MNPDELRAKAARYHAARPARREGTATPPVDDAERLATFERSEGEELRVSWATYEGRPFVRLSMWRPGEGGMWPVKGKALSIRVRELGMFADAVGKALDLAAAGGGR